MWVPVSHIGRAQHVTRAGNHFKIVMLSGWYSTDSLLHIPVWYGVMREREVLLVLLMSVSWRETTALTCWSSDRTNLTVCQLEKNNRAGSTVRWIFFVIFHPQFPPKYQVPCTRVQNLKCFPVLNMSTDDKGKNVVLELLYSSTEWEMLSCTQTRVQRLTVVSSPGEVRFVIPISRQAHRYWPSGVGGTCCWAHQLSHI